MKKAKKIIVLLLLSIFIFSSQISIANAYECGSWITTRSYNSRCDTSDGCGFLWLKGTSKHDEDQYRICTAISGSTVYIIRETRTVTIKDGCCDK